MSFDESLFRKEYEKAFRCLDHNDRIALRQWAHAEWSSLLKEEHSAEQLERLQLQVLN